MTRWGTSDRLALLDLDGVICDDRHRVRYALAREWGDYFALCPRDTVWPRGREVYEACLLAGWDVAYCTGRRRDLRRLTRDWLGRHGFDETLPLIMRQEEDRRPLAEVKATVVTEARHFGFREVWLYDDDPQVIKLAAAAGAVTRHCTWYIKPERMVKRAAT